MKFKFIVIALFAPLLIPLAHNGAKLAKERSVMEKKYQKRQKALKLKKKNKVTKVAVSSKQRGKMVGCPPHLPHFDPHWGCLSSNPGRFLSRKFSRGTTNY